MINIFSFLDKKKNYNPETVLVLEEWFIKNLDNPYASAKMKIELAKKTSLSVQQVSKWLMNKRKKIKEKPFNSVKRLPLDAKLVLKNHFESISEHPNRAQIKKLSNGLNVSEKRISQWFAKKRFEKNKLKF